MARLSLLSALVCVAVGISAVPAAPARDTSAFEQDIRPLLEAHCMGCHGAEKPQGNINFAAIADDSAARKARRLWRKALAQIKNGEMPPADEKQIVAADRVKLMQWFEDTLENNDPQDRDPGPPLVRRLSHAEYNRTLRDLLGINFNAGDGVGIADDSQGFGFANQTGVLVLSPALMEKYFAAADHVLDRILTSNTDATQTESSAEMAKAESLPAQPAAKAPSRRDSAAAPFTKSTLLAQYKCAGVNPIDNQIRPHFQIVSADKKPVPLRELTLRYWFLAGGSRDFQHWCDYAKVDATNITRSVKLLPQPAQGADAYVEIGFAGGTLDAGGTTGEIQIRVAKHDWKPFEQTDGYSFDASLTNFADAPRVTLYRDGKLVWGKEPEATGTIHPPPLLVPRPAEKAIAKTKRPPTAIDPEKQKILRVCAAILIAPPGSGLSEKETARKIIEAFASKAWRRPVEPAEIAPLMAVYARAVSKGADFTSAIRPMLKAVLVSPSFLFRMEQDQPAQGTEINRRVSDHELATRLSYFIWSSMPDQELVTLATKGRLSDPAELEKQALRMLADPKARALTENFGVPWLRLGNLAAARPSIEFFPTFGPSLKDAMYQETTIFFDMLRQEDRSLLELLDADYTYANQELARHYGLLGVEGPAMRKIQLTPQDHRGGLLGMGSILASTSHTFRTSPTLRGRYVLEVILGTPPSPPPANVGVLKDDTRGKPAKTFRETLSRHSSDAACAACHNKIDPLGFGLETFDGVGQWRQNDASLLDASGELPTGEKFSGPEELKQLLVKRQDQFLLNLSEQILMYALGRPLEDCDEPAVREIQTGLAEHEQRFSLLVLGVVKSFPFQHRRYQILAD